MVETELIVQKRAPPTNVVLDAKAVAAQRIAGRVHVTPNGDNWHVYVDGTNEDGPDKKKPPADVPRDGWDDGAPKLDRNEFESVGVAVEELTEGRSNITKTYDRASSRGNWRITINYEDPRT